MKVPNFQPASILQRIGIAPGLVAIVVIIDSLLFSGEVSTLGATLILSIPVGVILAVISAFWQRRFYGDSWTRAIIKGIILGFLTAIPTPIASVAAIIGAVLPMLQQESVHINGFQKEHRIECAESTMKQAKRKTLS